MIFNNLGMIGGNDSDKITFIIPESANGNYEIYMGTTGDKLHQEIMLENYE